MVWAWAYVHGLGVCTKYCVGHNTAELWPMWSRSVGYSVKHVDLVTKTELKSVSSGVSTVRANLQVKA